LFADLERMSILRRLPLARFNQQESIEFLQRTLGGEINLTTAATMHAQAEGVPFILGEQVRAYRDAGLVQQIDRVWTLARNAERLMPSAVRTLIERRAARLPEGTRTTLSEAAVLGRTFSLRDLREVKRLLGDPAIESDELAESLEPAVRAGFLVSHPDTSAADFSFVHGQVREHAANALRPGRKRAIHAAIVEMLTQGQSPAPESLPLLAQHALAAGQSEACARFSIEAAQRAIGANAPEEALRLVELAHPVASTAADRVALLRLRDDALKMLRRSSQRLEGLAELSALAEALGDAHLDLEVMLRRAAALRSSGEQDRAAGLAGSVRALAIERGDEQAELLACLELGQNLLRSDLGEGYVQTHIEADLDGAAAAFQDAVRLAREQKNEHFLAIALRELGTISVARLRQWFVEQVQAGEHIPIMRRLADGEQVDDILPTLPVAPIHAEASRYFMEALELFERLGNRQGAMSTIIAMAFVSWGPEIHLGGSAKRIEEIRRLAMRMESFTNESDRALAEAQMLFGSHVYSRAKLFPGLAIEKGQEAYTAARTIGDKALEFAAAGGVALSYADVGLFDTAEEWLARASDIAGSEPTPYRARQLQLWRGLVRAAAGDASGMQEHLSAAIRLAGDQGRSAARCEALAALALEAGRIGAERADEELLRLAEASAREAKGVVAMLPGHPPWAASADAALARVATGRGARDEAAEFGRSALAGLEAAQREDWFLEIVLPAAEALILGGSPEEGAGVREQLRITLAIVSTHVTDEDLRARWFRSPLARQLVRLADFEPAEGTDGKGSAMPGRLEERDIEFLKLLSRGNTNGEIAEALEIEESEVNRRLLDLYTKIGASSRADATSAALLGRLV
jgi:DNA-binding CsgD family transcriptional regulator/tetratricopeptide (TPR) repeat protein